MRLGHWQQRAPKLPGAQDQGQPVRAADLALPDTAPAARAGFAVDQPLVLGPQTVRPALSVVLGQEDVETPMGPAAPPGTSAPAQDRRGRPDGRSLAGAQRSCPCMLLRQDADTWIELTLKSAPLQAAPESTALQPRQPRKSPGTLNASSPPPRRWPAQDQRDHTAAALRQLNAPGFDQLMNRHRRRVTRLRGR